MRFQKSIINSMFLIFVLLSVVVYAIPKDPNVFYGSITLNGETPTTSCTLKLYVNDTLQDEISVSSGKFGGPNAFDEKLTATGSNGDIVKFVLECGGYTNIQPILQMYEEGKVERITLNFNGTEITTGSTGGEEQTNNNNVGGGIGGNLGESSNREKIKNNGNMYTDEEKELFNVVKNYLNRISNKNIVNMSVIHRESLVYTQISNKKKENNVIKYLSSKEKTFHSKNLHLIDEISLYIDVIKVKYDDGTIKTYTLIHKKLPSNKRGKYVIEYIPKNVSETADNVRFIKGNVVRIIEADPILEVAPDNNGEYAYIVEGNKEKDAASTVSLYYEPENQQTQYKNNQTVSYSSSQEAQKITYKTLYSVLLLIILVGFGLVVYYLMKMRGK